MFVCVHVCEREVKQAEWKIDILAAAVSLKNETQRNQQHLGNLLQSLQCSFFKIAPREALLNVYNLQRRAVRREWLSGTEHDRVSTA